MLLLRKDRSHAVSDILRGTCRQDNPCLFLKTHQFIVGFVIFQVGNNLFSFLVIRLPRLI